MSVFGPVENFAGRPPKVARRPQSRRSRRKFKVTYNFKPKERPTYEPLEVSGSSVLKQLSAGTPSICNLQLAILLLFALQIIATVSHKFALAHEQREPFINYQPTATTTTTNETLRNFNGHHNVNQCQSTPQLAVRTKYGHFCGVLLTDRSPISNEESSAAAEAQIVGFLGLRYASAPVKRLRFMPPTAYHYNPNQVHDARQFGPICMQRFPFDLSSSSSPDIKSKLDAYLQVLAKQMPKATFAYLRPQLRRLARREQSEDCLNLNVYVPLEAINGRAIGDLQPEPANRLLPILVLIHGDSLDFGAGSVINGFKLAQQQQQLSRHKLIVVTFNYRLNILGFPPRLMGATRGNLGLMDQVAALHWIKDNAMAFGGSPRNITLMGTRRAAPLVNLLMLSPLAKGLFHRAILEDGSALSPLVSSSLHNPILQRNNQHQQQQQQPLVNPLTLSLAVQYTRLLAKLCDCPIYLLPQVNSRPLNIGASQAVNMSSELSQQKSFNNSSQVTIGNNRIHLQQQQQLQQLQRINLADETKTNALTIECLRQKPVELLLQRIPLDLIHLDAASGELSIDSRLLLQLLQFWQQQQQQQQLPQNNNAPSSLMDFVRQQNFSQSDWRQVPLSNQQVRQLIAIVQELELRQTLGGSSAPPSGESYHHFEDQHLDSVNLAAVNLPLIEAIYGPPTTSVKPLFGPVIDGTIVPEEDIATSMLALDSPFNQRDLLIGLSKPISSAYEVSAAAQGNELSDELSTSSDNIHDYMSIGLASPIYERISSKMEKFGISSEQTIELVNLFVRSFYKYHNQEITNSIINHYLSSIGLKHQLKLKSRGKLLKNSSNEGDDSQKAQWTIERQVLVLDALINAFQDALVNVPVIRAALIHSTRQLETLVDAFVGQTFEKWTRKQSAINSNGELELNEEESTSLMRQFSTFAKSLLSDSNWPLELMLPNDLRAKPNTIELKQPKGTFLYQLDSSALIRLIHRLTNRLKQTHEARILSLNSGWRQLYELMKSLLIELESPESIYKFKSLFQPTLACGLEFEGDENGDNDDYYYNNSLNSTGQLANQLSNWICNKFNTLIAAFVTTGHLKNADIITSNSSFNQLESTISELIAQFEDNCLAQPQINTDHHSVQAANKSSLLINDDDDDDKCKRQLIKLAFKFIINEQEERENDKQNDFNWPVFSPFTQQIASLPGFRSNNHGENNWKFTPIQDSNSVYFDEKSTFISRASFWSNFVQASNCSKTQPVLPSSLLMSTNPLVGLIANHSMFPLLNMNLAFNCQSAISSKTAFNMIESLIDTIKMRLFDMKSLWLANSRRLASAIQNHHTLRMANISHEQTNEENLDQQQQEKQQFAMDSMQPSEVGSNNNGSASDIGFVIANLSDNNATYFNWAKLVQVAKGKSPQVILLSCALLALILFGSGALIVLVNSKSRKSRESEVTITSNGISLQAASGLPLEAISGANEVHVFHSEQPINNSPLVQEVNNQVGALPSEIEYVNGAQQQVISNHSVVNSTQHWNQQQQQQVESSEREISGICVSHALINPEINQGPSDSPESFVNLIACSDITGQSSVESDQMMPIMMPLLNASSDSANQQQQQRNFLLGGRLSSGSSHQLNGYTDSSPTDYNYQNSYRSLIASSSELIGHSQTLQDQRLHLNHLQHQQQHQHKPSCLSNYHSAGNHSAGSAQSSSFASTSTTTTNNNNHNNSGNHSQTGTMKKRVKISDPLGDGQLNKSTASRSILSINSTRGQWTGDSRSTSSQNRSFCPVHSNHRIFNDGHPNNYTTGVLYSSHVDSNVPFAIDQLLANEGQEISQGVNVAQVNQENGSRNSISRVHFDSYRQQL